MLWQVKSRSHDQRDARRKRAKGSASFFKFDFDLGFAFESTRFKRASIPIGLALKIVVQPANHSSYQMLLLRQSTIDSASEARRTAESKREGRKNTHTHTQSDRQTINIRAPGRPFGGLFCVAAGKQASCPQLQDRLGLGSVRKAKDSK